MMRIALIVSMLIYQAVMPAFGASRSDPSLLTIDEAQSCRGDIEASHRFWIESRKEMLEKMRSNPNSYSEQKRQSLQKSISEEEGKTAFSESALKTVNELDEPHNLRYLIKLNTYHIQTIRTDPAGAAQAWIGIEVGKLEGSARIHGMLADNCLANQRLLKMQSVYGPTGLPGRSTVLSAADFRKACGGTMKEEDLEQINSSTREWIEDSREYIKRPRKGNQVLCAYRARLALIDATPSTAASKLPSNSNPSSKIAAPINTPSTIPLPAASAAKLTQQQIASCSEEIRRAQLDSQSWAGDVNAVAVRLGRFQKDLFEGRCAGHPEAKAYIAGANKMLGSGGNAPGNGGGSSSSASAVSAVGAGSPDPKRTRKVHNPAADAKGCSKLIPSTEWIGKSAMGGNFRFVNNCPTAVEFFWCADNECTRGSGNTWTIHSGGNWPVSGTNVRWGACRGANSGGFDKDTQGQKYTCPNLKW